MRPVSERLFTALMLDLPLSPAAICDFGIVSPAHHSALQRAVRSGVTLQDLDAAFGDGQSLTNLVRGHVPGPAVVFVTPYDTPDAR